MTGPPAAGGSALRSTIAHLIGRKSDGPLRAGATRSCSVGAAVAHAGARLPYPVGMLRHACLWVATIALVACSDDTDTSPDGGGGADGEAGGDVGGQAAG